VVAYRRGVVVSCRRGKEKIGRKGIFVAYTASRFGSAILFSRIKGQ
jgi:hypothetical protein